MESSLRGLRVDDSLDVRGVAGPAAYQQARARLAALAPQDVLELHIDEGEALESIPFGLRADGHELLVSEPAANGVRLLVRKREPPAA